MPKTIARVCQIGTTNYVDYKGERLTVEEHEAKHGVKLKIPKNVKVCDGFAGLKSPFADKLFKESERRLKAMNKPKKVKVGALDIPPVDFKHGSRAKKDNDKIHETMEEMYGSRAKVELHDKKLRDRAEFMANYKEEPALPKNLRRVEEERTWDESFYYYFGRAYEVVKVGIILLALASLIIHSLRH